jgi:hypothetical protein
LVYLVPLRVAGRCGRCENAEMRVYYWLVVLFVLVSVPVWRDAWPFVVSHWVTLPVFIGIAAFLTLVRERIRSDRGGRWLAEYRQAHGRVRPLARLRHALPVLATYPLVIGCYCAWRLWLNRHIPFTWDQRIATLEGQAISYGLTRAIAAWPPLYRAVEFTYGGAWLLATLGLMTYIAFQPASVLRTRYLVTLALVFPLAGNVLAGLLMSAGPVYYGEVVCGPDVYAPTVAVLDAVATWMRPGQVAMWLLHSSGASFPSTGITAMPSMHLVVVTLAACWFWGRGRHALAVAAVAFTLVGSVVTGWHYWLDGVVAIVVTVMVWHFTRAGRSTGARSGQLGEGT